MKKKDVKRKCCNICELYLKFLGVYLNQNYFCILDKFPKFEYTEFSKNVIMNYYFCNSIKFPEKMNKILTSYIESFGVISSYDFHKYPNNEFCDINSSNKVFIDSKLGEIEANNFKLNAVAIAYIDNDNKRIRYEGGYCCCSDEIGDDILSIASIINVSGIADKIDNEDFFNHLIVESYQKYREKDYKMSFFLLFSAFENFVNLKLNIDDEKQTLSEKYKELYKTEIESYEKNDIYTAFSLNDDQLKRNYEKTRNDIAHGNLQVTLKKEFLDDAYFDFLSMILLYQNKLKSFDELYALLKDYLEPMSEDIAN